MGKRVNVYNIYRYMYICICMARSLTLKCEVAGWEKTATKRVQQPFMYLSRLPRQQEYRLFCSCSVVSLESTCSRMQVSETTLKAWNVAGFVPRA